MRYESMGSEIVKDVVDCVLELLEHREGPLAILVELVV